MKIFLISILTLLKMCTSSHISKNSQLFYGIDLQLESTFIDNRNIIIMDTIYHYNPLLSNTVNSINISPRHNKYLGFELEKSIFNIEVESLKGGTRKEMILYVYPLKENYEDIRMKIINYLISNGGTDSMDDDSDYSSVVLKVDDSSMIRFIYSGLENHFILNWIYFERN